jgi:hypothetical protein
VVSPLLQSTFALSFRLAWAKESRDPRISEGQQSPLEKKILVSNLQWSYLEKGPGFKILQHR